MSVKMKMVDEAHLVWIVEARSSIQHLLLSQFLYARNRERIDSTDQAIFDHLVGAAFSLWRAVFLSDTPRSLDVQAAALERFLESVVRDNAITYQDDKINNAWTVGYYLTNARLRLIAAAKLKREWKLEVIPGLIRVLEGGTGEDKNETQVEWLWTYVTLGNIFKEINPTYSRPAGELLFENASKKMIEFAERTQHTQT
jgi:hypothetical protein